MVDRVLLHMRRLGSRKENLDDYTSEAEVAPRNSISTLYESFRRTPEHNCMPIRIDITVHSYSSANTRMAHCAGAKVALDVMLRVCIVAIVKALVVGAASHIRSCVLDVWYFCKYK